MKNQHLFSEFTKQYPVQKTLRFELKPVGATLQNIEQKGFIKEDKQRAEDYKKVKEIIDVYHRKFIEESLYDLQLEGLNDYFDVYTKNNLDDNDKKALEELRKKLRKQIAEAFKNNEKFITIGKKELISEELKSVIDNDEDKERLINKFKRFTTYFTGFHENRKNMYVADDKATAISYRIIHENLPKLIDNMVIFNKIKNDAPELLEQLKKGLKELNNERTLEEIFSLNYVNKTITQKGIDHYNNILGGRTTEEGKKKIKGLNEYINTEYNQKQKEKKNRLPRFKQLYKQILSDRESVSFIIEAFKEDKEVLEAIETFYQYNLCNFETDGQQVNIFNIIQNTIGDLNNFDLSKIYVRNDRSITDISQTIFGDWSIIRNALQEYYINNNPKKNKEKPEKFEERIDKWVKRTDYFDIQTIQDALNQSKIDVVKEKNVPDVIINYFADFGLEKMKQENENIETNLFDKIDEEYEQVKDLLNTDYPDDKNLINQKGKDSDVEKIKNFLDSIMNIIHFIKPLKLTDETKEKDETFYSLFVPLYDQLSKTILLYNRVRNYVSQKPYSNEKFKLNFDSSHLLSGWAQDYDTKGGMLFEKDGNYYMGIIEKKFTNDDKLKLKQNAKENPAYRIIYDFQKPDNKNIPRLFIRSKGDNYSPAVKKYELPIERVLDIYDNGKFKTEYKSKNYEDFKKSLSTLIDYYKEGFKKHEAYKHYDFKWKKSEEYHDISEFYNDVIASCYQLLFEEINYNTLIEYTKQGKIYLFQVYSKDFSKFSKGKPNLHTMYWRMIFDKQNLDNVVVKLNGEAEVFYRERSINNDDNTIHKANTLIANKNPDNTKKESRFEYDIIKDKRYTMDKFKFHVPITLNFKSTGREFINEEVNKFLQNNPQVNVIGIDRGERHLAYYTVINQKGGILEQDSFNVIKNIYKDKTYPTDYHEKLEKKESERDKARKSWDTIGTIKELKEGYISQVVHKIAQLMIKHNAIVVFEDLNFGFKRGRQKVEKQVYQKLEKMLIDKLNYLVFKDHQVNEPGGVLNAFQLANKFVSFDRLGKQSGFIFYVPAALTSKIDPATGFVDFLKPRYKNMEQARDFIEKFDVIKYNKKNDYFEFCFDYTQFTTKADGTKTKWVVCTHGDTRYRYNSQSKASEEINITNELKGLLDSKQIEYKNGKCIKNELITNEDKSFYVKLFHLLFLSLSMRQSKSGTDIDFILSPVADENGVFFDSRNAGDEMPKDADANGAYHIALKGLLALEKINKADEKDMKKLNLAISNKEWIAFAQQQK